MKKIEILLTTCLIFMASSLGYTQNKVYQLKEVLHTANDAMESNNVGYGLNALAFELVPTIYYKNDQVKFTAPNENPVRVILDAAAIDELYEISPNFKTVEIIIIQLDEGAQLASPINAESLSHFERLKYIYFSCSYSICDTEECSKEELSSMVKGSLPGSTSIIYTSEINE